MKQGTQATGQVNAQVIQINQVVEQPSLDPYDDKGDIVVL